MIKPTIIGPISNGIHIHIPEEINATAKIYSIFNLLLFVSCSLFKRLLSLQWLASHCSDFWFKFKHIDTINSCRSICSNVFDRDRNE